MRGGFLPGETTVSRMALDRTDCRAGLESADLGGAGVAGGDRGVEAPLDEVGA